MQPSPQGPRRPAPDPFGSAALGPRILRNRIVRSAMFEGQSRDNLPNDELIEVHRRAAAGGVGLTTVSYLAVAREGLGAPNEVIVCDAALPGLGRLVEAVHAEGGAVSAQIGHAGPVGAAPGKIVLGPSAGFTMAGQRIRPATDDDLGRVTGQFARAASLLAEVGFDAIEVHLGHNYLPSSFLSPRLNRRRDAWGGDVERRARFPRQILRAVRAAVGQRAAITAKLNMADGYPGGLWLNDSIETARLIESDQSIDALELTGGSSLRNPMYLFRGEAPRAEFAAALPPLLGLGFRLVGRWLLKEYPFEEAYFLGFARQFRAMLRMPLILLGGINRLETMQRAMAEGFEFVAMGRALLRDPDLPAKLSSGAATESMCIHCNRCMTTIYTGTRCVLPPVPAVGIGPDAPGRGA